VPSLSQEVQQAIASVETEIAFGADAGFATRAGAIDSLEIHVLDRLRYLEESASLPPELLALRARATVLMRHLEAANEQVVHTLHRAIRTGEYTPATLLHALIHHAAPSQNRSGYDALDLLVGGLLDADGLPQERATREPEMVAYQPTPARSILQLIERANIGPADFLYDLGSGLGRVAIMVGLLSGARARGIEFEPAYCEYALRCARRLNVSGVDFLQADVRDAPLAEGTVYFLYTPCRGELLRQVLERLRAEASERLIRICTYGPCTAEVAGATWLRHADDLDLSEYEIAVFEPVRVIQGKCISEQISPPGQDGQTRAIVFDRERRGGRSSNR
jgi:hypothetical protein